jgi:phosphate transport system substrate-binding protein
MITMNRVLSSIGLSAALLSAGVAYAGDITGAGATFPYPVYAKWAEAYRAKTGVGLNYQSIGSGGGIKQIKAKTVDFGASDAPLKPEELNAIGLTQFPTVVGGVVPVVNVPGIAPGELKLTGKALADIYQGKITKWNDPEIAATNSVGAGAAVQWPVGTGGKGNEGVASYVQRIKNSIGYVEYAYALQNHMTYVELQNRDGQFVKPVAKNFQAAAANAHWDANKGFYEILTNEPGANSWPITGATFILIYKSQDRPENAKEALKFFDWAYTNGDKLASDLDYVPLPDNVTTMIRGAWKAQIKDAAGSPVWK